MYILRWIIGAALFVALLFLALQNSDPVTLKFYHWWSWQAPLVFVVLIAFASGVAAGLLAGAMRSARLKRQLSRMRRERVFGAPAPGPHGATPAQAAAGGAPRSERSGRIDAA